MGNMGNTATARWLCVWVRVDIAGFECACFVA